jgi:hypothetical protein
MARILNKLGRYAQIDVKMLRNGDQISLNNVADHPRVKGKILKSKGIAMYRMMAIRNHFKTFDIKSSALYSCFADKNV